MSGGLPTRDAIVATAGESIARGSKSFAAASRLFDRRTRERAWLLYAWCRACDDIADGQDHGQAKHVVTDAEAEERLEAIRVRTAAALEGRWVGDPAFDALRIVVEETGMPHRLVWDVVEGFALDAAGWRPRSEADLFKYSYHVAGAVGCMMAVVMGVSPHDQQVLDRACDLGLAFQLANIARDIEADDRIGRCYLPEEWLVEMDIPPGEHVKPHFRQRLTVLARRLAKCAACYEDSARGGTLALSFRSAWAVLAAAGIYGAIARKVSSIGDHAWDHRVTIGRIEKLGWIARAWWQALRRKQLYSGTERPAFLWQRPR
ncbi:phytoene/squalene synthase family protein [Sphingomonas sp. LM7]|uniref:phytoene/squalene synthase family protein n=1 Tax=Sphingomonas sp. LM7 TaxID=1938607 RepID=UPI000983AAEC|nr:phytoene/squalene synthase family protein [Sphingomonas sp. LM7]AQR74876.1 phytoene synthase [Sphingomonas sp. LM7]